jgi:cytoskeletal protein CcmA (bactofilin family)
MDNKRSKGSLTVIGEGTEIHGELRAPHPVRVEGTLKGKLATTEMLTIASSGIVEAVIQARSAVIGGKIVGNVDVEDRVELEATSSLTGDLKARELVINEGAHFHGNCSMETVKGTHV